ncbi:MAG TPA: hypothetical protein VHW05_13440 [Phenylobacterium sp.]|jgi:hypothetical protein|nr:hypothetical protein [Phenylobacterium sp.]
MCDPVTALAVVSVVSTAASVATEIQGAQAQNKAIGQQLQQQNQQANVQEVSSLNDRARQARVEQGRMAVAAGEAGLQLDSGSVEQMLLNSAMQQKQANEAIETNRDNQVAANTSEANRYYSSVQEPSVIGAGLRLVGAGVTGFAQGRSALLANQQISNQSGKQAAGG